MSDSENPSSSEVKWQIIWFALLALGLAAMIQPCGNVLCVRAKNHRFYMRAAPIICIADVAQFLAFVFLGFNRDLKIWLSNIKFELRERFEGESGAKDQKAAENSIIIRWILMILGASQIQVIKLMAMQGIPWTKAWAMMFGISIVFGEVLILLVRFLKLDDGAADTPPAWRAYKVSDALDHIGIIPFSLQLTLSWGFMFVFGLTVAFKVTGPSEDPLKTNLVGLIAAITSILLGNFWLAALPESAWYFRLPMLVLRYISQSTSPPITRHNKPGWTLYRAFSFGCFAVISFSLLTPLVLRRIFPHVWSQSVWLWTGLWSSMSWSFCLMLWGMANSVPNLIHKTILGRLFRVDSFPGSQAVVLAFLTFLAGISYYAGMYDSSGTINPAWTGIFG